MTTFSSAFHAENPCTSARDCTSSTNDQIAKPNWTRNITKTSVDSSCVKDAVANASVKSRFLKAAISATHKRMLPTFVTFDQDTAHLTCINDAAPPIHLPVAYKRALAIVIPIMPAKRERKRLPSKIPTRE